MARKIEVEIVGDTASLERALSRSGKKVSAWRSGLDKAAKGAKIGLLAVGAGAIYATRKASDLNEAMSAANTVFGESADQIIAWSKNTQDAFSQTEFLSAAKTFAGFGQAAGLAGGKLNTFSKDLIDAAQDMASFHNVPITQALDDIRSGLAGETEPLRKYQIMLSESALQQEAMRIGLVKSGDALTEREKVLARQSYILNNLGAAEGDWNRTRDQAANKERIAIANTQDLAAQLGTALLPVMDKVLTVGLRVTDWMGKNATTTKILIGVFVGLAVAIWAVNFALAANPFTLVAIAIAALTAGLVILWQKYKSHHTMILIITGVLTGALIPAIILVVTHWKTVSRVVKEVAIAMKDAVLDAVLFILARFDDFLAAIEAILHVMGKMPGPMGAPFRAMEDAVEAARQKVEDLQHDVSALHSKTIHVNAVVQGLSYVAALQEHLALIAARSDVNVTVGKAQTRARGGPVNPRTAYIVGEQGPELFVPRGGGRIVPNGAFAGGGGGSVNVIVLGGDRSAIEWLRSLDARAGRRSGRGVL